jgi:transposase
VELAIRDRRIAELEAMLAAALKRIEELERRLYGKKSEKMPRPAQELRETESAEEAEERRVAALEKRREHAALKQKINQETVRHPVPQEDKECPKCGGKADRAVGEGKHTTEIEYVPGRFVQRKHIQETVACRCGEYIATAPAAPRALDKSLYGPGFIAHLVTMKCADSIPLYRLAKQYQRNRPRTAPWTQSYECGGGIGGGGPGGRHLWGRRSSIREMGWSSSRMRTSVR